MAFPTNFDESNCVLDAPPGMSEDQCAPLCVLRAVASNGVPVVISCWKLTPEELVEINRTGRVWLSILGVTMPPAVILGTKPFAVQG
jgi:hypothetical protein